MDAFRTPYATLPGGMTAAYSNGQLSTRHQMLALPAFTSAHEQADTLKPINYTTPPPTPVSPLSYPLLLFAECADYIALLIVWCSIKPFKSTYAYASVCRKRGAWLHIIEGTRSYTHREEYTMRVLTRRGKASLPKPGLPIRNYLLLCRWNTRRYLPLRLLVPALTPAPLPTAFSVRDRKSQRKRTIFLACIAYCMVTEH